MKEPSLSRRLIFIFSGLFALMLAIAALFAYQSAKTRIDRDYDAQLISESGFVQLPHKNKYGREYGPEPASAVPYGGR